MNIVHSQESSENLLASSYDNVPYTSSVYQQSQPHRLHALAKMKGLNPPPIESARVLEIGCSFGGNLLPFAILYPQSQITGVDLSAHQIRVGRQLLNEIGVDNVELIAGDISQVSFEHKFDYIICHGVYSWVPETVRDAILSAVENYLMPNGVAYISYNTYPGWKEKDIVKDLMNFGCTADKDSELRFQQANAMFEFTKALHEQNQLNFKHMGWLESVLENPSKSYIVHEYLEYFNQPFYLKEFIAQANRYHLAYITDSSTPAVLMPLLGKAQAFDYLCQFFNNNVVDMEQYLDFVGNRTFRGSILVHQEALKGSAFSEHIADYNRCHDFKDLYLHVTPIFHPETEETKAYWSVLNESSLNFENSPTANCLFEYLQKQSPNPVKLETIINKLKSNPVCEESKLIDLLLVLVHLGVSYINYTDKPQPKLGRKPKLNPKFQKLIHFVQNNPGVVNLSTRFFQSYHLNVFEATLAAHIDGTKSQTELVGLVRTMLEEGVLNWLADDKVVPSNEIADKQLKDAVKCALNNLYMQGYFWVD